MAQLRGARERELAARRGTPDGAALAEAAAHSIVVDICELKALKQTSSRLVCVELQGGGPHTYIFPMMCD